MADAPKILETDFLDQALPKLNKGIENANEALRKVITAADNSNTAYNTAKNVQEQFNQVVIEGDSSVETAQARVDRRGRTFTTLKEHLDEIDRQLESRGVDVKWFGAKGDGVTNDVAAVKAAITMLQPGQSLEFTDGTYVLTGEEIFIPVERVTFKGNGAKLIMDYGFRPTDSHFTCYGLHFICPTYSTNARAIYILNKVIPGQPVKRIRNFNIRYCIFENFFYSAMAQGGEYNLTGLEAEEGYPVRDFHVERCLSITYSDKNAGHFQAIQVENVSYLNNDTYGGQGATSYNAIKGNGYMRIIGNYDDNNSYGSCEVENASGKTVISGNTFKKKIWVDDSSSVKVTGNHTDGIIHITVGSNNGDAKNITVSDNTAAGVRAESFGTYAGGLIDNLKIVDNIFEGTANHGIFIDGKYCKRVTAENNDFAGENASARIGVVRNDQLVAIFRENNVNGTILITGTGGLVHGLQNYGATYTGQRDPMQTAFRDFATDGITLISDNGTRYRLYVGDTGAVYTVSY